MINHLFTRFNKAPRKLRVLISALSVTVFALSAPTVMAITVRQGQWFLDAVHAPAAQAISRGEGVVVCVLDTGVDAGHPDLTGVVMQGKSFGDSPSPDATVDTKGHGTAMAGLIAAQGGGINKALGIAPGAKILPVAGPQNDYSSLVDSIKYCVDHGAKILNFSGGRPGQISIPEKDAITYAVQHDVVVVTSMGNRGQTTEANGFASLPGVIAVTGTIQADNASWPDSWTGPTAALSAPAQTVSTYPKAKYSSSFGNGDGTSDSAAIVSGVAALVRAKYPELDAANVINRLIKTSTDLGAPGRDSIYGFGLVDAERALTMDVAPVSKNPLGEPQLSTANQKVYKPASTMQKVALLGGGATVILLFLGFIIWLVVRKSHKNNRGTNNTSYNPSSIPPATTNPWTQQSQTPGPGTLPPGNVIEPQPQAPPTPEPQQPQNPTQLPPAPNS